MSERLFEALEDCITAINSGRGLEECLAKYPDLADELRTLIETSTAAKSLTATQVPAAARNRSRTMLLEHAARKRKTRKPWLTYFRIPRLAMSLAALLVVLVFSFNGLIITSAKTIPGDTLYPVKRAAETVRLKLTNNVEKKHQIEVDYTRRRTEEVIELLQLNRTEKISMEGKVEEISPERWIVSGIKIQVAPETKIIGDILLGQVVEVEGSTNQNGWIAADELHLRYFEITDVIGEISDDEWTIGEIKLLIAPDAQINPALEVGDHARVLVYSSDNGRLYARAILTVISHEAEFEPFEITLSGIIDLLLDDSVNVDEETIRVSDSTIIANGIAEGSWAQITVLVGQDGTLTALSIEPLSFDIETRLLEDEENGYENKEHKTDVDEMQDAVREEETDDESKEMEQNEGEAYENEDDSDSEDVSNDSSDEEDDDSGGEELEDNGGESDEDGAETEDDGEDDESNSEQDDPADDDSSDDEPDEETSSTDDD